MLPLYQLYGIKGFAFDFDGTLAVPTLDFALMRQKTLTAVSGVAKPETSDNMPLMEQLKVMGECMEEREKKYFFSIAYNTIKEVELEAAAKSSLFPFVRPMLHSFQEKNIPFAIITRNCKDAVHLVFPDVLEYASCLLTRDDVAKVKPHPEHLLEALKFLSLPAKNVMMVGDHPMDIIVGHKAKTLTAGVASGESSLSDLLAEKPTCAAQSGEELLRSLHILDQ